MAELGSSDDMLQRLKSLLPNWFAFVAPIRDAILGGIAGVLSWQYGFSKTVRLQTRLSTTAGYFLDIAAFDYLGLTLQRKTSQGDDSFRQRIKQEVLRERVTRAGMIKAITDLTGNVPSIFEPWNPNDTGGYGCPNIGYGVAGGWGSMQLPAQVFIRATRGSFSGVPGVSGFLSPAGGIGGYGVGHVEYIGPELGTVGVTDADIYQTIMTTKATGSIAWVAFVGKAPGAPGLDFRRAPDSQYLL